jgi:A/G-specific adenine glycosylase
MFHMSCLSQEKIMSFQKHILDYYAIHGRMFVWRQTYNPYHILVSEIMLQQTQTDRVIKKYEAFIAAFPTLHELAAASLHSVLILWQGLGYNRRCLALHKAAQILVEKYGGSIPSCPEKLQELPGIGAYTAGAICAFAYNKPVVFIETNIRTVFIHYFFVNRENVKDAEIMPFIEKTLYTHDPRLWYYALMDYGAMLKKQIKNPNTRSAHYVVQSKFEGSDRQVRGAMLRLLLHGVALPSETIMLQLGVAHDRGHKILLQLCAEGFIKQQADFFSIVP